MSALLSLSLNVKVQIQLEIAPKHARPIVLIAAA